MDIPISFGKICRACQFSDQARNAKNRFGLPQKRTENGWETVSWDVAYREISKQLKQQKRSQIGLYVGEQAMRRSADFLRAMNFGVAHGLQNVFSSF